MQTDINGIPRTHTVNGAECVAVGIGCYRVSSAEDEDSTTVFDGDEEDCF